ncbi:MAG: hypothetical protein HY858_09080 [Candidatus Solibacter usitatus]|nr:hypothetical protein [Candidatus Solibacter usitatus]
MIRPGVHILLALPLAFSACRGVDGPAAKPAAPAARALPASQPALDASDAARFLAGLPGRPASRFKALEAEPAWTDHARNMNELWALFETRRKEGMAKFHQSELSGAPFDGRAIWYPFSGADALTMLALLPGHTTYAMAALEPPGRVPHVEDFPVEELPARLPAIAGTLSSLLGKSFFVTREMDHQLRGQVTDGVAEPILILLARLGYDILDYSYVQVDETGRLASREEDAKPTAFGYNRSLSFDIRRGNEPPARLVYVSLNLDDRHLRDNPGFRAYVASLNRPATLLKATSYMLHDKGFSVIRDLILEHSHAIIQDDSGIPWSHLNSPAWQVRLYGGYTRPYGESFQFRKQPALREAYEANPASVKPLPFRMGYGAGRQESNLQVAIRNP